jgi:hypothetical protein
MPPVVDAPVERIDGSFQQHMVGRVDPERDDRASRGRRQRIRAGIVQREQASEQDNNHAQRVCWQVAPSEDSALAVFFGFH